MTPAQCQQARKLLGWTRTRLTGYAFVSEIIIKRLECGLPVPALKLVQVRAAFEQSGVEFTSDDVLGVRLRSEVTG